MAIPGPDGPSGDARELGSLSDRTVLQPAATDGGAAPGTAAPGTAAPGTTDVQGGRAQRPVAGAGPGGVRDRQVVLLAGLVVALVLGLQALSLAFPAFADAIDNPPTVIALLVIVTALILVRALLAARRPR